ncbi:MAG: sugar phosphate isomerase/epimerase [Clostridia bacterium]|nr:sugar phosphate isomerase/epimerase [Clostridia bacterium]
MKFGVAINCFKIPVEDGIIEASKIGASGVQTYATTGAFSPEELTSDKKLLIKALLKENDLVFTALTADMGGYGFQIEKDNPERIEKTKKIIDLAEEFGAKVITTHVGVIPSDERHPRYEVLLKALVECGRYAKSKGVTVAIETGPEDAVTLKGFLDKTLGGVGVNLDPANFVMVTGQNPADAVYTLKDYIVHTHVKDGIMLKKTQPKIIYDHFASGGKGGINVKDYFLETVVGQGDVDYKSYLKALIEVGYDGYLTVERESGDDRIGDSIKAIEYVKGVLKELK